MGKTFKFVITGWIAVALLVGFTGAVGAVAIAASSSDTTTARTNRCGVEQRRADQAGAQVVPKERALNKAKTKLKMARAALRHADPGAERKAAKRKVIQAKAGKANALKAFNAAKRKAAAAEERLRDCQNNPTSTNSPTESTSPTPTTPPVSPIQEFCDAGLPQEICDAFLTIPPPPGGATGAGPIQALCVAGLPQPICDAAEGESLPNGDSPIQPLCDAGLPPTICDIASGQAPGPGLPGFPGIPSIPGVPGFPGLPAIPGLP